MGGYGSHVIYHEGYGFNKAEARRSLDALLQYHYDGVAVRVSKEKTSIPPFTPRYFVLDAAGEHPIRYDRLRGKIRAYVMFD